MSKNELTEGAPEPGTAGEERKQETDVSEGTVSQMSYEYGRIYTGDARELAKAIPDGSIDLIFTDPPYPREFLPLYGWLAETAAQVLKPDGFMLTYCGNSYKDEIFAMTMPHLSYFWDYQTIDGAATWVFPRKTIAKSKSILAWRKQGSKALPNNGVLGVWVGTGSDKRWHKWGQDESSARYFIDCFLPADGVVLEPFAGGGTVPAVCKALGWKCIAFEVDPTAAASARERLTMTQRQLFVPQPEQAAMFAEVTP